MADLEARVKKLEELLGKASNKIEFLNVELSKARDERREAIEETERLKDREYALGSDLLDLREKFEKLTKRKKEKKKVLFDDEDDSEEDESKVDETNKSSRRILKGVSLLVDEKDEDAVDNDTFNTSASRKREIERQVIREMTSIKGLDQWANPPHKRKEAQANIDTTTNEIIKLEGLSKMEEWMANVSSAITKMNTVKGERPTAEEWEKTLEALNPGNIFSAVRELEENTLNYNGQVEALRTYENALTKNKRNYLDLPPFGESALSGKVAKDFSKGLGDYKFSGDIKLDKNLPINMFIYRIIDYVRQYKLSGEACYVLIRPHLKGHLLAQLTNMEMLHASFENFFYHLQNRLDFRHNSAEIRRQIIELKSKVPEDLAKVFTDIMSLNNRLHQGKSELEKIRTATADIRADFVEVLETYYPYAAGTIIKRDDDIRLSYEAEIRQIMKFGRSRKEAEDTNKIKWHPTLTLFDLALDETRFIPPTRPPGQKDEPEKKEDRRRFNREPRGQGRTAINEVRTKECELGTQDKTNEDPSMREKLDRALNEIAELKHRRNNNQSGTMSKRCALCNGPFHFWRTCRTYPDEEPRPYQEDPCDVCGGRHRSECKRTRRD
jgi:hypothetical protein